MVRLDDDSRKAPPDSRRDERGREQPIVTAANSDRVRAGVTGHNARCVLIVSLALVVAAFIVIAIAFAA